MRTTIVFIDDAAHARQQLAPLCAQDDAAAAATPAHWVLVACAPRMTHRISKWVSHSARENWRAKWADKLFFSVTPWLRHLGHRTTEVVATGPLPELQAQLAAQYPGAPLVDARRPKHDESASPRPTGPRPPWSVPGTAAGLGLLFVLAFE